MAGASLAMPKPWRRRKPVEVQDTAIDMTSDWNLQARSQHMLNKRLNAFHLSRKEFCTESQYLGKWDDLGMQRRGKYAFFYDVLYVGQIKDSMFHGYGTLHFPAKSKMNGIWEKGKLKRFEYQFADEKFHGMYCEMPDRRFRFERLNGIRAGGRSLLTTEVDSREIPEGCYDTGDGFYNPITKCVYHPLNLKKILRIPTKADHDWILKHCRKAWDEPAGYRPEFYENWEKQKSMVLLK